MGGRGAKAGIGGGTGGGYGAYGGGIAALTTATQNAKWSKTTYYGLEGVWASGYDANGNAAVLKFQGQAEDKTANFLGKIAKTQSYPDDGQYTFYQGNFQQFSLALGLNDKATVLSDAQFDQYVKQNNLQVVYRGERNAYACDRFLNSEYTHTGVGSYGDGFYFSEDVSTANGYARMKGGANGRVLKMALSPSARIISYDNLMNQWNNLSPKLQRSLTKAGRSANASYTNEGQAQLALKLGYNVVSIGTGYHYALTRDAFVVSDTYKHHY